MKSIERAKGTVRYAFKDSLKSMSKQPTKESLIMLHYSYGDVRFKYSTKYYTCLNDWDYKKQRIRNKVGIINRDEINYYLDHLEIALKKKVSSLDSKQEVISKSALKSFLDSFTNREGQVNEPKEINFYGYCHSFVERKQGSLKKVTLRSYIQTCKLISRFDQETGYKVDFNTIDLSFYNNFVSFLESDGKSLNTIGKHIKNLKIILNSAMDEGFNVNRAYKSVQFKSNTEQTTAIYLSQAELKLMHRLDLADYPKLEQARDIFLIGCYTGQRVSDYNGLDHRHIYTNKGVRFVKVKQQKVRGVTVDCPITVEMWDIMKNRYEGKFPPKMSEQYLNRYIKRVARMSGIDEKIKCVRTKGGEEKVTWLPKYKLVSTHTARRSFCTNLFKAGVSVDYIMHFSGHKGTKEFYKYIRIEKEEKALHIAQSGYFNLA